MALSETLPTGGFRTGTSRPAYPPGSGAPREGLTPAQVEQSRKQHGSNQLTQKKRNSFFRQFLFPTVQAAHEQNFHVGQALFQCLGHGQGGKDMSAGSPGGENDAKCHVYSRTVRE